MNDLVGAGEPLKMDHTFTACLDRARSLIPLLQSAADRIDAKNELPPDILDAMFEAGLFKLLLPKTYGGAELKPSEFIQCVEAIAEGDASAAWCMNQGSGCSMAAAYAPPEVAREVWGGKRDVLAWGQGHGAKAIRTKGGWRVTGTWTFGSGSRHATWLGANCPGFEDDGTPILHADGRPWEHTHLFRRQHARIEGVWNVIGLRGTGSDAYTIEDLFFIDDTHTITREHEPDRQESGRLYLSQSMQLHAGGFASVGLGVSRAMLDSFIELAKTKSQTWSSDALRGNHAVQHLIGYSDAAWKAARAGVHSALDNAWDRLGTTGTLSLDDKIQIREATTYAIHISRDVCHHVFHEAGATAIFNQPPVRAAVARHQQRLPADTGAAHALRNCRNISAGWFAGSPLALAEWA